MVSKEDVIKYVLQTPNNPNRKVLETLLDDYLKDNSGECPNPPNPDEVTVWDGGRVKGW